MLPKPKGWLKRRTKAFEADRTKTELSPESDGDAAAAKVLSSNEAPAPGLTKPYIASLENADNTVMPAGLEDTEVAFSQVVIPKSADLSDREKAPSPEVATQSTAQSGKRQSGAQAERGEYRVTGEEATARFDTIVPEGARIQPRVGALKLGEQPAVNPADKSTEAAQEGVVKSPLSHITPCQKSSAHAATIPADRPPVSSNFLVSLQTAGLAFDSVRFERIPLAELRRRTDTMVALMRDGRAFGIETRDGARIIVGQGGAFEAFADSRQIKEYAGWAFAADDERIDNEQIDVFADTLSHPGEEATQWKSVPKMLAATLRATPKWTLFYLFTCAGLINLAVFAIPLFTMVVYDRVIPHGADHTLAALTFGILIILATDLGLRMAKARLMESAGVGVSLDLMSAVFGRLARARLGQLPTRPAPLAHGLHSLDQMATAAPQVAIGLFVDLPFAALMMLYISFIGGWIVIVPIAAVFVVTAINWVGHAAAQRESLASIGASNRRSGLIDEMLAHMEAVKLRGSLRHLDRIWRRLNEDCAEKGHRVRITSARAAQLTVAITNMSTVGVMVVGALLIKAELLTIGSLVACAILANRCIAPVSQTLMGLLRFAQLSQATQPALMLLKFEPEKAGDAALSGKVPTPSLHFRNVTLVYPGAKDVSLQNLNLEIKAGEKIGLIGRIGSGKSTLMRLAPRLYAPNDGMIELGQRNLESYDPVLLRRMISFAPQESHLFDDTIYENLVFGVENIDPERFRKAVQITGVFDMVKKKAAGYSFRVGVNGRNISSGERQIVALARALIQDFSILILDEPSATLDNKLEASFIKGAPEMIGDATLIVSTHRLPVLKLVDRIVWLEQGRVIADGPRDAVLDKLRGVRSVAAKALA